jgi:hypothetical protein
MPLTSPRRSLGRSLAAALTVLAAVLATAATVPLAPPGVAASADDPFYSYDGTTPLSSIAPGTVLKTRTMSYRVLGIPTPVRAVQLLYRSADAQGRPAANVTSILRPLVGSTSSKAVSYQSFYDSLNPADSPSRAIAGNLSFGGLIANVESLLIVPLLTQGYTVIVPDTQGQHADFAAGPEYGMSTLDSIRAALRSGATGLTTSTRVGLLGYSGGAIGTNWAAALAGSYAPEVNARLVGMAEGGVLVAPAHNLRYVSGSQGWSGVMAMAIIGVGRAYDIDFGPYLSDDGRSILAKLQKASITNALFQYPGLTWQQLVKPAYADPDSIPAFVTAVNKLNLGSAATPNIPVLIGQGANGAIEGTSGHQAGIGPGDGVMIAGDVRSLARQYCATNKAVKYTQYDDLSHTLAMVPWAPVALTWINDRFAGKAAPSSCGTIAVGNPLTPEVLK